MPLIPLVNDIDIEHDTVLRRHRKLLVLFAIKIFDLIFD